MNSFGNLIGAVAGLTVRLDHFAVALGKIEEAIAKLNEQVAALDKRLTLQEHQLAELKETIKERGRRVWMVVGPLVGAAIGSLLTYALRK